MIYLSTFLSVITFFLACNYNLGFCQEREGSHIHPSELPTLGTELIQDRSQKFQVTEKKPKWKFFPNIGWYMIPQYSEIVKAYSRKKRKSDYLEAHRTSSCENQYITEFFTQNIILRALKKVKRNSNTKLGVKASILYTSTKGVNFRSYFFQTPDQGTELSAHVRLKVVNRLGTTFYYEISYRQGLVAIMPFVVEDMQKSENYSIAWYLTDSFEDEGKSLGSTATLLDANDKPENGIESLQKYHKYSIDRLSELLFEQFLLIENIGQESVENKIEQIRERLIQQNDDSEHYGQEIINEQENIHYLIIARWDDMQVEDEEDSNYIAYPFHTKALTNSKLSNLFTD